MRIRSRLRRHLQVGLDGIERQELGGLPHPVRGAADAGALTRDLARGLEPVEESLAEPERGVCPAEQRVVVAVEPTTVAGRPRGEFHATNAGVRLPPLQW
jgi:hypothetical protein